MLTERHCQLCSSDALSQNYTRLHSDWLIDMCRMIFLLSFRCWSSLGMFGLIWPPPSSRNGGCTSKGVDQWWCIAEYVTRCDQTIYYCVYLFKMINCAFLPLLFIEVFPLKWTIIRAICAFGSYFWYDQRPLRNFLRCCENSGIIS